jgi:hypothetical protein
MNAPKNNNIENKAQISLIPLDLIIPMLEPAYREGIIKYQRESWRCGFNATVMYDALMRHLKSWFFDLESFDPETKEKYGIDKHHLGAVLFCAINLYATEMKFPEHDNRPLKILEEYKNATNGPLNQPQNSGTAR